MKGNRKGNIGNQIGQYNWMGNGINNNNNSDVAHMSMSMGMGMGRGMGRMVDEDVRWTNPAFISAALHAIDHHSPHAHAPPRNHP
jgi:hypothetical protein